MATEPLFAGLMSGTSLDGIDAVVVAFSDSQTRQRVRILASLCVPIPPELRDRTLAICTPGNNEIDRQGALDIEFGHLFARAALEAITKCCVTPESVRAIGSHGQTIRHRPSDQTPFTLQVGDPNSIAEITGITTVADFRRRDIAAGGQGAPLVPAFHDAIFRSPDENRVVVNIGGMANITVMPANTENPVSGFDTGPGNVLLDAWHQRHRGTPVDMNGDWARSGKVSTVLLSMLLAEKFFMQPPPRSTGRELFNLEWLDAKLGQIDAGLQPADVQATLTELTAQSIADSISRWGSTPRCAYVCGGGAHNQFLLERVSANLPDIRITTTEELGVSPDWVEAVAFAWLARQTLAGLPGNLTAVTGARHPVVLGGIYPGRNGRV